MRRLAALALALSALAVVTACGHEPSRSPNGRAAETAKNAYAGLQNRQIRALSQEQVEGLLAGGGMGYALAAELNHYPGPLHTLELAPKLDLTAAQLEATRRIRADMRERARALGHELVTLEARLDRAFRSGRITDSQLIELTAEVGRVEAQLRATHLRAHLELRNVLTEEQVRRYDVLRGYARRGGNEEHEHEPGTHGD